MKKPPEERKSVKTDQAELAENQNKSSFDKERRWERFRLDIKIRARFQRAGGSQIVLGNGSDVSEGGMSAYLPAELKDDEVITLELSLPYASRSLFLKAAVRYRDGYRYGLEFQEIAAAELESLKRLLQAMNRKT